MKSSVQITHPEGVPMRFSESLSKHLLDRRDKASPFFTGSWLEALGDDELQAFRALAELCR
jgi:hypothetical protein